MKDVRKLEQCSEKGNPRISNTGVQNTELPQTTNDSQLRDLDYSEKGDLKCLVDWCEFTIPISLPFETCFTLLGVPFDEDNWNLETDRKLLGYSRLYRNGHMAVMTEGTPEMGHHVLLSGQGCRELELYTGDRWKDLFADVVALGGKFSRLDIAIDDFYGYFTIEHLIEKIKAGELQSKFKRARRIEDMIISTGETAGNTLYYGRGTSDIQIRMYEKNHEQKMTDSIPFWNRTELQMRKDIAFAFALEYVNSDKLLGTLAKGVLSQYITFRDTDLSQQNKSRWPISQFWLDFIGNVEKVKLATKKPDRSIEKIENWLEHQVSKSLALITLVDGNKINELVMKAYPKLDEQDEVILENHLRKEELKRKLFYNTIEKEALPNGKTQNNDND